MKKILYIILLVFISLPINQIAFADLKLDKIMEKIQSTESNLVNKIWSDRNCSQYSTKTLKGLSEYKRCKKGLKPSDKSFFKSLSWKGKKNNKFDPNKPCDEYSTKTFTSLAAKMKCKSAKKN